MDHVQTNLLHHVEGLTPKLCIIEGGDEMNSIEATTGA